MLTIIFVMKLNNSLSCKGSFGGCQGQPSARPWHLLLRSLGLTALLSSSSVRFSLSPYEGIAYPTLYHIVLFHRLPVIHARLACSLPYALAIRLTFLSFYWPFYTPLNSPLSLIKLCQL